MAASNYDPTYRHVDWIDNVDRVQAGGEHGFNQEFTNILAEFVNIGKALNGALTLPGITVDDATVNKAITLPAAQTSNNLEITATILNAPAAAGQLLSLAVTNTLVVGGLTQLNGLRVQGNLDSARASGTIGPITITAATQNTAAQVGIGKTPAHALDVQGDINCTGTITSPQGKGFLIPHPVKPEQHDLFHACLEGPEFGVYYRGEGRLQDGEATIELPDYFEALCRAGDRTVHLTPKVREDEIPGILGAGEVRNGRFYVRGGRETPADQAFYWEVRAVRSDLEPLQVVQTALTRHDAARPAAAPVPA